MGDHSDQSGGYDLNGDVEEPPEEDMYEEEAGRSVEDEGYESEGAEGYNSNPNTETLHNEQYDDDGREDEYGNEGDDFRDDREEVEEEERNLIGQEEGDDVREDEEFERNNQDVDVGGDSQSYEEELPSPPVGASESRRMRTPEEVAALEALFQENSHPTEAQRLAMMSRFGLLEKQFNSWFSHRRQKMKKQNLYGITPTRGRGRGRGSRGGRTGGSGRGRGRGGPGQPRRKRADVTNQPAKQVGVFGLGLELCKKQYSILGSIEAAIAAKAEAEAALSISMETLQRCKQEERMFVSTVEVKLPHFNPQGPPLALTFDDLPAGASFEITKSLV